MSFSGRQKKTQKFLQKTQRERRRRLSEREDYFDLILIKLKFEL